MCLLCKRKLTFFDPPGSYCEFCVRCKPGLIVSVDAVPPQDLDAESKLLGCLLIEPEGVLRASKLLKGSDFVYPAHRLVYKAVWTLHRSGSCKLWEVFELLDKGKGPPCGWWVFLIGCLEAVDTVNKLCEYVDRVKELALRRQRVESLVDEITALHDY